MPKQYSHCPVCFEPVDDCMCTQYTVKYRIQAHRSPKPLKLADYAEQKQLQRERPRQRASKGKAGV